MKIHFIYLCSISFFLLICSSFANKSPIKSNTSIEITWEKVFGYSVRVLAINSKGDLFAGTWGVLRSQDNGDNWLLVELPNETWEVNSIAINSNDDIFVTTFGGKIYRSTDNGDNWTQLHVDTLEFDDCYVDINSEDVIFLGTRGSFNDVDGLFYSNDNGDNWEQTNWKQDVYILAISPSDDIFIDSWGVYRSTDNGDSWTNASLGLTNLPNDFAFNSLEHIFTGTSCCPGGVFISTENGDNWTTTDYSFTSKIDSGVLALFIGPVNDIFVGTLNIGVVYSMDNGNSWTEINSGLRYDPIYGYPAVLSIIINVEDHILAATSYGIYRSEQPITSITEFNSNQAKSFLLNQNYPNPFNPSTKIEFTLPNSEYVELKVYNILGKEVATLVSNKLNQGSHTYQFDGKNLASGIYYYRIEAGEFQDVKKMVFLK